MSLDSEDVAVYLRRNTDVDWTEPFITKAQIAAHFGFSTRWVELRVREGMPCHRIGGRLRFQRSQAATWLLERGT